MRSWVAAIALAALLPGCAEPPGQEDFSRESLVIGISASGDFIVDVPLWLAPGGPDAEAWLAAARVHRGDANVSLEDTQHGRALRIAGAHGVAVEAQDVLFRPESGAADAFTRGGYSLARGTAEPVVQNHLGAMTVAWSYEAVSMDCSLFINHHAVLQEAGWHPMQGSGRSPPPDCMQ